MRKTIRNAFGRSASRVIEPRVRNAVEPGLDSVVRQLHERVDELARHLEKLDERMRSVRDELVTDVQTGAELVNTFRRSTARIEERTREIEAAVTQALGVLGHPEHPDHTLADLDWRTARFLNWSAGHQGFAAQAGLWFNPPVNVEHRPGGAVPGDVTERIVEVPYAHQAVAGLEPGAHILDFGSAESTTAFSLASLGYRVTALDLRPYPLEHPCLTSVVCPVEQWDGPAEPFDLVLCISTLEHIGLGAYGEEAAADVGSADRAVLERLAGWLRPGGELVFTAPYGPWEVGETQRVYDDEHLDALLQGWTVTDRRVCVQSSPQVWEPHEGPVTAAGDDGPPRAVVLLRATRD